MTGRPNDLGATAGAGGTTSPAAGTGGATTPATKIRHSWLVPILDALLEGGWIAVVDALFAATGQTRAIGPLPFALLALAALVWSRSAPDRRTESIGLGALYIIGFLGAGLIGGSTAAAGPGGASAITSFLGSFAEASAVLAAIAVFRGTRHVDPDEDDLVVGNVLQFGFPLLAVPWLIATAQPEAIRSTFVETAFPATLLFATAGLFAMGLSRLDALSVSSGLDWRRNRSWLLLLVGVLAVMTLIAVPAAFLLGTPIVNVLAGILGPLTLILAPIADVLRAILELVLSPLQPLVDFLKSLLTNHPPPVITDPGLPFGTPIPEQPGQTDEGNGLGTILVSIGLLVAAIVVLAFVVRMTLRRQPRRRSLEGEPFEEREYRLPGLALRAPRFSRPRRRPPPTTASEAYLGFLDLLQSRPDLARSPSEPPATHAARLRAAGFGDPRAAFLAADYELEHYAMRALPERETRRALGRLEQLRVRVRAAPKPPEPKPPEARSTEAD